MLQILGNMVLRDCAAWILYFWLKFPVNLPSWIETPGNGVMKSSRREFLKISGLALGCVAFLSAAVRSFAIPRKSNPVWAGEVMDCVITCPVCQTKTRETMPGEIPKMVYQCPVCLTWLGPKKGDHCIYDSYGSVNCPPLQIRARRARGLPIPNSPGP